MRLIENEPPDPAAEVSVRRVVAGYDGSSASDLALDGAIAEARARSVPLHLVCVVEIPAALPVDVEAYRRAAVRVLQDASLRAANVLGTFRVTQHVALGAAGAELLRSCRDDDLLVVGTHGHRPVARMLLGSVSTAVVSHAACPVLVVRGPRNRRPGPVVAGVDGSASSRAALAYAAGAAASSGGELRAVLALPPVVDALGTVTAPGEQERHRARSALSRAVAGLRAAHPDVVVQECVVQGHPVDALLRCTHEARLAVVGSRGLGGLRAMVMGSVSRELVHRADCPVAVVRGAPAPAAAATG